MPAGLREALALPIRFAPACPTGDGLPDTGGLFRILTALENEFGVRFRGLEVVRLKNVGELQALVDKKLG